MNGSERAICRGGPEQYDGIVIPLDSFEHWLTLDDGDYGGPGGTYERTDVVEQLPDGPAVRFAYVAADSHGRSGPGRPA